MTVDQEATFASMWASAVATRGEAPFLSFEGPNATILHWTYAEFDRLIGRAARYLIDHGVDKGDAVHLALTNSPAFIAVWLAATRLGAWIVPSDPMAAVPELHGHISRTSPRIGFCASARAEVYRAAATPTMHIAEVDEADGDLVLFGGEGLDSFPRPAPRDRAAVMFTSGTTGRPKGVEITQANYAFTAGVMGAASGLSAEHRQLVVLPMFHANAQYYSIAPAVAAGASVALMHTFSASQFLRQCARHRATHLSLFAAPIRMILARGADPVDGLVVEHCWYAMNIADAQYEQLSGLLGCRPRQLYGMTETIPAVLTDDPLDIVPLSVGFPTPGCVVDIQRSDGSSAPAGEVGEIVVGGEPGITLFAGYLDDPETTAASFRDGWFLTGDRARRDEHGRYEFGGRRADVLKVAGENVSTVEVEQVVSAHPGVLEAAVIGRSDPVRDEVPVAIVVARDPANPPSVDELHQWCVERLGKAKRPRDIEFVAELPRTSVGKIRKFLLRDPNAEQATAAPSAPTPSPDEARS